ncbi:hypothetical protein PIB30_027299 [Stylosanthes scabra]|uniref:Cell wall protein n=1 Tax=Stylosanthes scabra TaxID=79078 RepID=A0ABU6YAT2_9FABA|nr:hypothetical protein [Stylosanthes scabra]
MAHRASSSFIAVILLSNVLLYSVAARRIAENPIDDDRKEPEFLFMSHGGVHIPGIGPVRIPPFGAIPNNPFTGGIGGGAGAGAGPIGRSYVPGGDDTFVPNPGFEVPVPGGRRGRIPGAVHP